MLMLGAALDAGLPEEIIVSWLTVGFLATGALTIALCLILRLPICIAITTHGALLALATLDRLTFPELVGAYVMTGVAVALLTAAGLTSRIIDYLPLPVVMGMVIGVLLPFALRGMGAVAASPLVAGTAVLAYLVATRWRARLRGVPPTFWSIALAIAVASVTGQVDWSQFSPRLGAPVFTPPVFTARAFLELTIPLLVMVIGVHGTQAAAIMRGAGLPFPTRVYSMALGAATVAIGPFGATPAATMGPPLAMLLAGLEKEREGSRWQAGVMFGALLVALGFVSPVLAGIGRWLPAPLVSTIAGLAVLSVFDTYLARAFSGPFRTGAMFAFVVTASGVSFLGIGAALWGVVAGLAVSALVEPADFAAPFRRSS